MDKGSVKFTAGTSVWFEGGRVEIDPLLTAPVNEGDTALAIFIPSGNPAKAELAHYTRMESNDGRIWARTVTLNLADAAEDWRPMLEKLEKLLHNARAVFRGRDQ